MAGPTRILIAEDRVADYELARREIERAMGGCEFMRVETEEGFLSAIGAFDPDLIISDYRMPVFDGMRALELALKHAPQTPVVILTSAINEDTAVECMRAGAADYVIKEHSKRLSGAVRRALEEKRERALKQEEAEARRKLEAQLGQARKMETLGRLAGGVAHDFNNTVCVIQGYAELLKRKLAGQGEVLRDVEEIEKAAERARSITGQLLAFSRKQHSVPEVLDLNAQVGQMLKPIERLLGAGIELRAELEESLWRVRLDGTQLDQVLMNLAVNGRDAMAEGGVLTIATRNVRREGAADAVAVRVSDSGAGMGEEVMAHLFEPFFTTKEVGEGTGLGLAMVYGIVSQNGGWIEVRSKVGEGSEFEVFFPRHEGEVAGREGEASAARAGSGRILLVEDHAQVRAMTAELLAALGYAVTAVESPREALEVARRGGFDLLMSDVVMPGMSGPQLRERVVEVAPASKVLFMSGHAPESVLGDDDAPFLQKPFSLARLAEAVRAAMKSE